MDKETLRKEIDYHINIKNNLWIAIVTTIGGVLALLFTLDSILKLIFIIIGIILVIVIISGYIRTDEKIEKLFKQLKKGEEQ